MGLRNFINGVALVLLFSISLILFLNQIITANNPSSPISNDPVINSTLAGFQSSANDLGTAASNAKTRLESDQPSVVYLFLIIYSAFAIPLAFLGFAIGSVGKLTTLMFVSLFGAGSSPFGVVIGVVSGIILIGIVFYIMRAIRTGETER